MQKGKPRQRALPKITTGRWGWDSNPDTPTLEPTFDCIYCLCKDTPRSECSGNSRISPNVVLTECILPLTALPLTENRTKSFPQGPSLMERATTVTLCGQSVNSMNTSRMEGRPSLRVVSERGPIWVTPVLVHLQTQDRISLQRWPFRHWTRLWPGEVWTLAVGKLWALLFPACLFWCFGTRGLAGPLAWAGYFSPVCFVTAFLGTDPGRERTSLFIHPLGQTFIEHPLCARHVAGAENEAANRRDKIPAFPFPQIRGRRTSPLLLSSSPGLIPFFLLDNVLGSVCVQHLSVPWGKGASFCSPEDKE